jgi:hypothetical protein
VLEGDQVNYHNINYAQYDTRTQCLVVEYHRTFFQKIFNKSPTVDTYRLDDGNWYHNETFKLCEPREWMFAQRQFEILQNNLKSFKIIGV